MSSNKSLVLVDSSAWILALRKDGIENVRRRIDGLLQHDRVATCGLILCELLGGAKNAREFDRLERDLAGPRYLPIDEDVWTEAARVNFTLAQAGRTVPTTDCVIAATAIRYDVVLAHGDEHFDRVVKYTKLRVESYVHLMRRKA